VVRDVHGVGGVRGDGFVDGELVDVSLVRHYENAVERSHYLAVAPL